MDSLEGIQDELSRVGPILQRYAQLNARPSVSFAQDSPDLPITAQAFLSHIECTEEGGLKVICKEESEWNQLGIILSLNFILKSGTCGQYYSEVCQFTHMKSDSN